MQYQYIYMYMYVCTYLDDKDLWFSNERGAVVPIKIPAHTVTHSPYVCT